MSTEYIVIHSIAERANILQDNVEKGELKKTGSGEVFEFLAKEESGVGNLRLTNKVDGVLRPFSIVCYSAPDGHEAITLKIKDHIFSHKDSFYSIGLAIPIDATPRDLLTGSKFICRLLNFPFSHVDSVDDETKHQMKRHRGVAVGTINGLGADGFHVKIYGKELTDIGIPLTASSYILYTTR